MAVVPSVTVLAVVLVEILLDLRDASVFPLMPPHVDYCNAIKPIHSWSSSRSTLAGSAIEPSLWFVVCVVLLLFCCSLRHHHGTGTGRAPAVGIKINGFLSAGALYCTSIKSRTASEQ